MRIVQLKIAVAVEAGVAVADVVVVVVVVVAAVFDATCSMKSNSSHRTCRMIDAVQ